ncbi:MAG: 2Fe-2S iron-sulfur cluster-binding protein, partial [Acidobacteriota bacterium]
MSPDSLLFYVNGTRVVIERPDPTTLLVDWLRHDTNGLTGTKLSCGEGGCGACTVMLAQWDPRTNRVSETAINSCLRPLASVDGASIITTEGIGSTRSKLDPVQYRIAAFNGTQCGYCTPGFVMNMFTFLRDHPKPTQQEVEDLFDGHICRCTGFRPILEGMRSFAVDFKKDKDYHSNHQCFAGVPIEQHLAGPRPELEFPKELIEYAKGPRSRAWSARGYQWFKPATLKQAMTLKATHGGNSRNVKVVVGNTSSGIFNWQADDPHVLIDVAHLPELRGFSSSDTGLRIGAAEPLQRVIDELGVRIAKGPKRKMAGFTAMRKHL